jgi:sugar/nucleoside kinase (ribokinase family)
MIRTFNINIEQNSVITIFNFAPAVKDLNTEFNKYVDILVVNEVEAEVFTQFSHSVKTVEDAIEASNIVLSREGFHIGVIVTLGELGAVYVDKLTRTPRHFSSPKVKVVDTTVS